MKCDLCDQTATVFCSTIVEGKMQKVNLCKRCAEERGVMDPTSFALADLLFGLGKQEAFPAGVETGRVGQCPSCGLTADQLKKTGRVGCSTCYETFAEGLASIIKAMHKGQRHTGKVPADLAERRAYTEKKHALAESLEAAVREERYEEAARIRDEMASLEPPSPPPPPPPPAGDTPSTTPAR